MANDDSILDDTSLKVANYKCFGSDAQGFERILPFNLIIGRNNSGKSSLLDIIQYAVEPYALAARVGSHPQVIVGAPLVEADVSRVFHAGNDHGIAGNMGRYGLRLIGRKIRWTLNQNKERTFLDIDLNDLPHVETEYYRNLLPNKLSPFHDKRFKRLSAERNVIPEDSGGPLTVSDNGAGATRVMRHFLTHESRDSAIVETTFLDHLNTIFEPDAHFTRIDCVEKSTANIWEVVLYEQHKGRVPLSRSGSGLKTVILVLIFVELMPLLDGRTASSYIFAFEELENNLHPSVQRRLLMFLRRAVERYHCRFILTTHSPVEIDYFVRDGLAQVMHVSSGTTDSSVAVVSGHAEGRRVLDELDIRASDILQSNGVIWVEGPSDRIYVNRWIEIWGEGKYREGAHYQVLQYGGALLAHLTCGDPDLENGAVKVLRLNRNAAIMIDSDRTTPTDELGATKQRIIAESASTSGFSWVTAGRTVENYLPLEVLERLLAPERTPMDAYADVVEHIRQARRNTRILATPDKVALARLAVPLMTRDMITRTLDLKVKLDTLLELIARWNGFLSA